MSCVVSSLAAISDIDSLGVAFELMRNREELSSSGTYLPPAISIKLPVT